MNLPGSAVEFLDVFQGFLLKANKDIWNENNLPLIHVYTFIATEDDENYREVLINKIKEVLRLFEEEDLVEIHNVRDVSMSKRMYSVSFRLSKAIAEDQPVK
jgi:hypothetical protein